jgi:glycosyltransferase involved in cell wall biosynthesis
MKHRELVRVLLKGGLLVEEFKKLAEVHIVDSPDFSFPVRVWSKLNRMSGREHNNILNRIVELNPAVIFASSLNAIDYAMKAKEMTEAKLICNLHELESSFHYAQPGEFVNSLLKADWLMMGSNAVKEFYIKNFSVDPNKVSVIYDFTADESEDSSALTDIRKLHNLPATARIVGGMGTIHWRKGNELFIYVAREVLQELSNTYFIWVGGHKNSPAYKQMVREVKLLGLSDKVILAGEQTDIYSYYNAFDVFLLTSREDPFPLVCLESGIANVPVICFENSGGMPEFVRNDAGYVIPYLDIFAMKDKTIRLLTDDDLRRQMGQVARERALNNHTIGKLGPSILALIESMIKPG